MSPDSCALANSWPQDCVSATKSALGSRQGTRVALESTQAVWERSTWVPGVHLECESRAPNGPVPQTSRIAYTMGRVQKREPITGAPLLEPKGYTRNVLSTVLTTTHLTYTPLSMSLAARPPKQTLYVYLLACKS